MSACFVSETAYSDMQGSRRHLDFDPSVIGFEGAPLPYDIEKNTIFIPQACDEADWTGVLYMKAPYTQICISYADPSDKAQVLQEGRSLKMAVLSDKTCMECNVVFTGLPVVCLDKEGGKIELEEEYLGEISVLDPYLDEYQQAACNFHIRGATSTWFDKKSYRVELLETASESDKKSFLGMRKDDDWILNSVCTDRSLVREKICYDLWKRVNEMEEEPVPSSEIEFCELFLNGEYMGVYGLMYPVDAKLMNMRPGDLLYKVGTWYEELNIDGKLTDYNGNTEILNKNGVAYLKLKYPKNSGKDCIYDPFELYQDTVFETGDLKAMEKAGIRPDTENFILHELFCEMTRAGDNTWKNLFLAAYGNVEGGYTLRETIWDLNYTFGDDFTLDPENGNTVFRPDTTRSYKLRYDRDYGYSALVRQIDGLREDTAYKWKKWRAEGISPDYIISLFEQEKEYLTQSGAFNRNADKWNTDDIEAAYAGIEEWIIGRYAFLDEMYGYDE